MPLVKECVDTLLEGNGKMLRPLFLILSAGMGSIEAERMYKLAAGVELLHMASLVHDDIIDNSSTRRHKPTLHTIYGKRTAVLMGDYLFSKSFTLLASNTSSGNESVMTRIMEKICEGEIQQNVSILEKQCSMRTYRRQISAKTALLFALSFYLGASESGCNQEEIMRLRRTGYNIGMSFQLIDDILDYTGSEGTLGKPRCSDLKEGIYTAPLICSLKSGDKELAKLVQRYPFSRRTRNRILQKTRELGGIEASREIAQRYSQRALREIGCLTQNTNRDKIENLVKNLLDRDF